jgi:PilZ domain
VSYRDLPRHVALVVPPAGRVVARVEEGDMNSLVLDLGVDGGDLPARGAGTVVYTTEAGVHRAEGTVRREDGRVRFTFGKGGYVAERRRDVRVTCSVPALLASTREGLAGERTAQRTLALDVSLGGLLVADPSHVPLGESVWVGLEVAPGKRRLPLRCRVVRDPGGEAKGLQIEEVADRDEHMLLGFIFERRRRLKEQEVRP